MNHIRDKLPDIKAKLNSLIGQTQHELTSYGDPTFTGKAHRVCLANNECLVFFICLSKVNNGSNKKGSLNIHIILSMVILGLVDPATVDQVC
jgi:hypothetical protein